MNRSHLVALAALLGASTFASDAATAFRDASAGVSSQVAIGAAPAEPWAASAVEVDIDAIRTLDGRGQPVYRPGKKTWDRTKFTRIVQGTIGTTFDTDLASNVMQIAFEPTTIDPIEVSSVGDVTGLVRYRPGPVKPGRVTFTLPMNRSISDWVRAYIGGKPAPRDIAINMKNAAGVVQRSVSLRRAMPTSYATDGKLAYLTVQPEGIAIGGAVHKAFVEWATGTLSGSAATRDLKISYTDLNMTVLSSTTLKGSLLTEISWTTLSASSKEAFRESFTVQPESIDPLP